MSIKAAKRRVTRRTRLMLGDSVASVGLGRSIVKAQDSFFCIENSP
ncbi:hypothetical protein HC928_01435 [bacterium]|nr:hypothetical protein [bacterium]